MTKDRPCATPGCAAKIYRDSKTGFCINCLKKQYYERPRPVVEPAAQVDLDREKKRAQAEFSDLKHKYEAALRTIEHQESVLGWIDKIRAGTSTTYKIEAREGSGTSEATPILVASDWHSEEIVKPASVSGLNEFNLDIFEQRASKFWQASLRLIRLLNQDVRINTVVIGLLGDFITNDIHDENAENNALLPIDAIINAQNKVIAGLDFLLNNSKYDFVVVCKVGNHSRTTKKVRMASEMGHSLESLMYVHLAGYFRNEPRLKFVIEDSYHTYIDIFDRSYRFHHGHELKYQGGIGGIFIPAFKAVSQWNKGRPAELDIFGHFHQSKDGGSFVSNGSLIGYNAYAIRNKFDFEEPKQTLIMVDKKRGRTCLWPILVK